MVRLSLKLEWATRWFLLGLVMATIGACRESDLKRLVAYSSIRHIMAIPLLVRIGRPLAMKTILIILVIHGFSSSLIFFLVGLLNTQFNTRQIYLIRGRFQTSFVLGIRLIIGAISNLAMPPFARFWSELWLTGILRNYYLPRIIFFLSFFILRSIYTFSWLVVAIGPRNERYTMNVRHREILVVRILRLMPIVLNFIIWSF